MKVGMTLAVMIVLSGTGAAMAQAIERPDDPLGMAIREPRVRVVHDDAPGLAGTSMDLQTTDPWLAYKRGNSLFQREWRIEDGVFALAADGYAEANANSCAMCHNMPYRSGGFGGNAAAPVGHGRNIPHLFGVGLIEMIGLQIRQDLYARYDTNGNGFLDVPAETEGQEALVEPVPGQILSYGYLDDLDGDGGPDLNMMLTVNFVDAQGRVIKSAWDGGPARLGASGVAGYDLSAGIFAASISDHQFPTLRRFSEGVMRSVMGFRIEARQGEADEGRHGDRVAGDGWGPVSNAGAAQLILPAPDFAALDPDDCEARKDSISAGEIDLLEWYLLNAPRPGRAEATPQSTRGAALFAETGCAECHVADWQIKGRDPLMGHSGDRRFFDLAVVVDAEGIARGDLAMLADRDGEGVWQRRFGPTRVQGIYSDFRHHEMGERFAEYYYGRRADRAFALRRFRTPPLWGVGSSAPYGHDGRSPTLDHVIRRHGGEAEAAAQGYAALDDAGRADILAFLSSLVLYQPDQVQVDLDGDGAVQAMVTRSGRELGPERFRPELLFAQTPVYAGWDAGHDRFSLAMLNVEAAYGLALPALVDVDGDQMPDILQAGSGTGACPKMTNAMQ
ncbi:di-heme oxidoredictase family protein [Primorskyibacter sp. 2E107]|uniref:di-heme oxidoredictase family protein n=1 Tax=Primorskyibacter sp. 2E107 TaxID=3403458 RepID=UPI003AF5C8C0